MNPDRDCPAIILTTDFGVGDPYVGVMKGVILGLNPRAAVVDLTHGISPQNVRQGAFILGVNHRYFHESAIHVAVVDPGVGTDRLAILVQTPRGRFPGAGQRNLEQRGVECRGCRRPGWPPRRCPPTAPPTGLPSLNIG